MTAPPAAHKTYILIFSLILSISLMSLLAASFYIQPLEGELTRLGSYAERDFGCNISQKKLPGNAGLSTVYDGKSDVLIVGDSFSTNGVWQPFFRQKTGLSYVTLNIRQTSLPDLLESEQFKKHPPKILIVETVERELLFFFKDLNFACGAGPAKNFHISAPEFTEETDARYYEDTRKTFDPWNINLRYTASVMINGFMRKVFWRDSGDTRRFALTKGSLFSNRKSGEMLIYAGDMNKFSWRKKDIEKAVCAIRGLQDRVQSDGKTLFIFMLAPDKSSAYADYIDNNMFRQLHNMHQLLADKGVNTPRIDLSLKGAISRGEKDIYCPNGTHWSARGYELAAEGTVDFIRDHIAASPD